jgi:hypothetical protein
LDAIGSRAATALLLFASLLAPGLRAAAEPRCLDEAQVCLEVREEGRTISFRVENREAAPHTVRIVVSERHNLLPLSPLPFRAVLEPGEQKVVGVLAVGRADQPTHYEMRWGAALGDARARHAVDARYRMPFGGKEPRALTPAPAARPGHEDFASHALDFALPFGTPVLAARRGRVVRIEEIRADGALRTGAPGRAVRVDVLHDDGTVASYANLRPAGVEVGDTVATGERIGASDDGAAGGGRPLRVAVWKREADLSARGIAIRFDDGSPQGAAPRAGVAYAPGGHSPEIPEPVPLPAARRHHTLSRAKRLADGACACGNGAMIHVDLPCEQVCGY